MILRWTRYEGATSYKITVAPQSSPSNPIAFATFGPNTVMGSINSLSPNILYTFTVDALDNSQGTLSSAAIESSTAPEMMDPIQTVKPKDSKTLMVEFSLKTGATSYVIRIQNNNGFNREDTVSSSPTEIQNLTPYTEYTLSIMAVNAGGRSQPSSPVTAKTVLPPPQLSASSPSNDSITVSWSPVAHAVRYSLTVYKFGSNSDMKHNTSSTSLTITGLDAGSLYIIRGFAWDMEGRRGEGSLYINQTTRPPTPSSVNVSMVMSNGVAGLTVSWELDQEVHGSIEYNVMSDQNLECNSTSSSCVLSPVSCGEVHSIQVTPSNEAGPGFPTYPTMFITYPCPPESLALIESPEENCTLTWDSVAYADSYQAFIKRGDGKEETCNTTTSTNCTFHCQCGYTYLMSTFAFNQAGSSPEGEIFNHTTVPCCPEDVTVSVVSTDTLEIMWKASRGAELYETRAVDSSEIILCNDTAPVCALSDLSCDRSYSVVVTPCNDISGCNRACKTHTKDTAPCTPTNLVLNPKNSSCVSVSWTANNRAATYTVSAMGNGDRHNCTTSGNSCDITDLPCGSTYEVSVVAANAAGQSLPSFSDSLETEPCCPLSLTVDQVTQAMSNVSWSHAKGAHSFITSLTSPRGHARCHTQDSHCLMGCITCGTNYTVTMEAYSHSGRRSNCSYEGFSSSACCPSGVRLYKTAGNSVRVHWRNAGSHSYVTEMTSTDNNYNCTASPGENSCDISDIQCGGVYDVVVAPLTAEGSKVMFCPKRLYWVTCSGNNISTVIYRGKRSLD
ncbi:fibronectin type III domain-containing protein 7-like isoform X2 [Notolabrus celidotus]|nr:fibronectin type III domain-containing protein 7-like isoform X2 [Notolabrus celidotus]